MEDNAPLKLSIPRVKYLSSIPNITLEDKVIQSNVTPICSKEIPSDENRTTTAFVLYLRGIN